MRSALQMVFVALLFSTTACATIFHGSHETVRVDSSPQGAWVVENNVVLGQTPGEFRLDSSRGHVLSVRLAGFYEGVIGIGTAPLIGYYVLDALLTFGIGILIDVATKSILTFDKNDVFMTLTPVGPLQGPVQVEPGPPTAPLM